VVRGAFGASTPTRPVFSLRVAFKKIYTRSGPRINIIANTGNSVNEQSGKEVVFVLVWVHETRSDLGSYACDGEKRREGRWKERRKSTYGRANTRGEETTCEKGSSNKVG
jgi:hypothetical protein